MSRGFLPGATAVAFDRDLGGLGGVKPDVLDARSNSRSFGTPVSPGAEITGPPHLLQSGAVLYVKHDYTAQAFSPITSRTPERPITNL